MSSKPISVEPRQPDTFFRRATRGFEESSAVENSRAKRILSGTRSSLSTVRLLPASFFLDFVAS